MKFNTIYESNNVPMLSRPLPRAPIHLQDRHPPSNIEFVRVTPSPLSLRFTYRIVVTKEY